MPKVEIDYSNTIIYKITCKDPSITDVYVGHTTNFVQRKQCHKQSCNNEKTPANNCKLYKVIRENGGWENWIMGIVNFFNCHDHYEARKKEQEYFTLLNATLNSIEPLPKQKEKKVVIKCTPKPNPTCDVSNTKNVKNMSPNFYCEKCEYKCSKKFCWDQHLSTSKHKNAIYIYECECGKKYKHHPSFYRHKKNCKPEITTIIDDNQIDINSLDMNLIMQLLKQNDEFKGLMVEQNNKMMEIFQEVCKNGIKVL